MENRKMIGKNEIVKRLALKLYGTENNVSEQQMKRCAQICDYLADIFKEAFLENEKIVWRGFITAEVVERPAHKGRHPQTNEVVVFPPVKTINCRISKFIKDLINEKRG